MFPVRDEISTAVNIFFLSHAIALGVPRPAQPINPGTPHFIGLLPPLFDSISLSIVHPVCRHRLHHRKGREPMDSMQNVMEIDQDPAIPNEVCLLCSALETGQFAASERRARKRRSYRTPAYLQLFSDAAGTEPTLLFTRDVDLRGVGFLTKRRLPLGYGGMIQLRTPDGRMLRVHGTLIRCRPAAPGWYEGALSFNREQPDLMDCFCRESSDSGRFVGHP
jgi:hypothetical protein